LFIFKVTEPNSMSQESIAAQAAYQLRYKNTEYYSWVCVLIVYF